MKNIDASKIIEELRKLSEATEKKRCSSCGAFPKCVAAPYWATPYRLTWPPPALPYTLGPVWVVDHGSLPRYEVTAGGVGLNGVTYSTQSVIAS